MAAIPQKGAWRSGSGGGGGRPAAVRRGSGGASSASGRWLLVANLLSDTVNLFSIDPRSGRATDTGVSTPIPSPDCITFFA
jgi:hypothetical protein